MYAIRSYYALLAMRIAACSIPSASARCKPRRLRLRPVARAGGLGEAYDSARGHVAAGGSGLAGGGAAAGGYAGGQGLEDEDEEGGGGMRPVCAQSGVAGLV